MEVVGDARLLADEKAEEAVFAGAVLFQLLWVSVDDVIDDVIDDIIVRAEEIRMLSLPPDGIGITEWAGAAQHNVINASKLVGQFVCNQKD